MSQAPHRTGDLHPIRAVGSSGMVGGGGSVLPCAVALIMSGAFAGALSSGIAADVRIGPAIAGLVILEVMFCLCAPFGCLLCGGMVSLVGGGVVVWCDSWAVCGLVLAGLVVIQGPLSSLVARSAVSSTGLVIEVFGATVGRRLPVRFNLWWLGRVLLHHFFCEICGVFGACLAPGLAGNRGISAAYAQA